MSGWADALASNTALMTDVQSYVETGGFIWCGTGGGSANAQTFTPSPVLTAYATGQKFIGILGATNTAATTLNVSSLGAKSVVHSDGSTAMKGGELISGIVYKFVYDGANMRVIDINTGPVTWSPTFTGFSANPASPLCRYQIIGRRIGLDVWMPNNGTSNTTGFTMTAPVTAATVAGMNWGCVPFTLQDNGAIVTATPGRAYIASASSTITIEKTIGTAASWTAANGKSADFHLDYEI